MNIENDNEQGDVVEARKHSGVGIASFILSILSGVFIFLLIVIAGVIEINTPGGMDENSAGALIVGLFLFFFLGMAVLGLGLGLGGLFQRSRKKIFAILGALFAALSIMGTLFIMLIGIIAG